MALSLLTKLQTLILNTPELTQYGTVPSESGLLTELKRLQLISFDMAGDIPSKLAVLTSLRELQIQGEFKGQFYQEILWHMTLLEILCIGGVSDFFVDTVLFSHIFRSNSNLQILSLEYNGLQATLPATMGLLTQLEFLDLWHTKLNGTIPTEIGNCHKLERLILGVNNLSSGLPTELGKLTKLVELSLYNNYLSTMVPFELGLLTDLELLMLQCSNWRTRIPRVFRGSVTIGSMGLWRWCRRNCVRFRR